MDEDRLSPYRRAIIHVIARREAMLTLFEWWFTQMPPVYLRNNVLKVQPALNSYMTLLSSQSRDLKMLGATEIIRLDPSESFARAIREMEDQDDAEGEKPD